MPTLTEQLKRGQELLQLAGRLHFDLTEVNNFLRGHLPETDEEGSPPPQSGEAVGYGYLYDMTVTHINITKQLEDAEAQMQELQSLLGLREGGKNAGSR